jgi:predicted dehydrogenase
MMMQRRKFLSTGMVLGSGLVFAPVLAEEDTPPCRVALIGCGRQGRAIINAGLKIPGLKFTALCDILPSALRSAKLYLEAEDVETTGYADYKDMLDKENGNLDAVIIASPDFVHAEQTIAALKTGLHVYCDSPMATGPDDARKMIQTAKESKRLLQIGFERRSDPRYRHVVEKLVCPDSCDLLLGKMTHFETQANRRVHPELIWAQRDTLSDELLKKFGYESMREYRNWRQYRRYGGGSCVTYLAQQLDVMEWFFGVRPTRIQAMGGLDYYDFGDSLDNVSAILAYPFPQGIVRGTSRVWTTTSGGGTLPFEHVYGINGSIQTSLSEGSFRLHAEPGFAKWAEFIRRGDLKKENVPKEDEDPNLIAVRETGNVVPYLLPVSRPVPVVALHLGNFVDAIQGKASLHCSGEDAFAAHAIAWKIAEAAEKGFPVELTEETFVTT